jgi:hypothetical protein
LPAEATLPKRNGSCGPGKNRGEILAVEILVQGQLQGFHVSDSNVLTMPLKARPDPKPPVSISKSTTFEILVKLSYSGNRFPIGLIV